MGCKKKLNKKKTGEKIYRAIEKSGLTYEEVAEELGVKEIPVFAVASHDTGSAVASVPVVDKEDFIYISSGTWSLMGVELDAPNSTCPLNKYYMFQNKGINDFDNINLLSTKFNTTVSFGNNSFLSRHSASSFSMYL